MENINLNYEYGLQRHRPQIYSESNSADNTFRSCFSKYQPLNSKTANAICYGNMCSTKPYPFLSKIHTIRTPHQIHIDAKTSRVWKYSSEDKSKNFPPGTTFVPHRHSVKSGLDFVDVLCTQSQNYLPILMENNRNHQITLNKGVIGYSSLDISDRDRPKYQIRDCVQMVNSILTENDQYNEMFSPPFYSPMRT